MAKRFPSAWVIVAEADYLMRSERWGAMLEVGLVAGTRFQDANTWSLILSDSAFRGVAGAMANYWDVEVTQPAHELRWHSMEAARADPRRFEYA